MWYSKLLWGWSSFQHPEREGLYVGSWGPFLEAAYISYCCLHSFGWNSSTWPYLTAREARKWVQICAKNKSTWVSWLASSLFYAELMWTIFLSSENSLLCGESDEVVKGKLCLSDCHLLWWVHVSPQGSFATSSYLHSHSANSLSVFLLVPATSCALQHPRHGVME